MKHMCWPLLVVHAVLVLLGACSGNDMRPDHYGMEDGSSIFVIAETGTYVVGHDVVLGIEWCFDPIDRCMLEPFTIRLPREINRLEKVELDRGELVSLEIQVKLYDDDCKLTIDRILWTSYLDTVSVYNINSELGVVSVIKNRAGDTTQNWVSCSGGLVDLVDHN